MTPLTWLDASGRRRPALACWTCGCEVAPKRMLGHLLLMSTLLVGCATPSAPLPAPPAPRVSREYTSTADLLTDVVGKIHDQYVDSVSVGRLTIQAIQRLETLVPGGVIQVVAVGS